MANDNTFLPIEQLGIGIIRIPAFTFTVHCFPNRGILSISINVIAMDTAAKCKCLSFYGKVHTCYVLLQSLVFAKGVQSWQGGTSFSCQNWSGQYDFGSKSGPGRSILAKFSTKIGSAGLILAWQYNECKTHVWTLAYTVSVFQLLGRVVRYVSWWLAATQHDVRSQH